MYWSRLSDHIGRKPVLLVGTFALAIATTSFGLSRAFWALVVRYHFPGSIIILREFNGFISVSRCIFTAFNSNAGMHCDHKIAKTH